MSEPRVAHVVRRFGGVTEPFIAQRVAATSEPRELWTERLDADPGGIQVRLVRPTGIGAGGPGDRLFHRLPSIGPPLARAYRQAEAAARPDVVHAHYLTTAWLIASHIRAPLVVSTYGFDVTLIPRRRGWPAAIRSVARAAAFVLTEGPFMRQTVLDLGFAPDQVRVVPIAAGLDRLSVRAAHEPGDGFRLISCGRMIEKKGHDLALRAFAMALPGLPAGATLEFVGDGPVKARLEALARELRLTGRIVLHGSLSRSAYLDLLGSADLLVAASRQAADGDSEGGAPTTILDAQALGVVAVGSTHCDIPYLIEDGETGYLADEDDVSSLAGSLLRAYETRADWGRIAANARRQVDERHSDAHVATLLRSIHAGAAESS